MPFINEIIKSDDVKRFNIEAINNKFNVDGQCLRTWIVDRDRNMYLRCVAKSQHGRHARYTWTFYWYGDLLVVEMELLENTDTSGGAQQMHWKLCNIAEYDSDEFPPELQQQQDEILEDLGLALNAFDLDEYAVTNGLLTEDDQQEGELDTPCDNLWIQSMSRIQSLRDNHL